MKSVSEMVLNSFQNTGEVDLCEYSCLKLYDGVEISPVGNREKQPCLHHEASPRPHAQQGKCHGHTRFVHGFSFRPLIICLTT